jgi:hypothetical protein
MMATLEHLMVEANKDGRMCPQPMVWNRLWELLPNAPGLPSSWAIAARVHLTVILADGHPPPTRVPD